MDPILLQSGFAMLVLEGLKLAIRQWIVKDPNFDFPLKFYAVATPVMNVLVMPFLALLGFSGFVLPTDWLGYARTVAQLVVTSLVTSLIYNTTVKPAKDYAQARAALATVKAAKAK